MKPEDRWGREGHCCVPQSLCPALVLPLGPSQWLFSHQDLTTELTTPSSQPDGAAKEKWVWRRATPSCLLSWRLGAAPTAPGAAQPAFARMGGESFLGDSKHDMNCCVTP